MAAQKGKDLLIKIADGGGFTTVAGMRTRRIAFNAETVDVTDAESTDRWRELLQGAGVKRASISGRGPFKDENRPAATVPTTLAEAEIMQPALQTIIGIALGALSCSVTPSAAPAEPSTAVE